MSKYQFIAKKVKVGYPNGFKRFNHKTGKKDIHVKPYTRDQKVKVATSDLIIKRQKAENDWAHLSYKYPNLLGLTDKEIDKFIKESKGKHWSEDDKVVKEYLKHIKALDKDDIRELSKKAYKKFNANMTDRYMTGEFSDKNPYSKDSTIFITSPRGGFNILGDFGYANKLNKKNFPYDLERLDYYNTVKAESLPYGYSIDDVNDIVFIDDIYMSGEQCHRAYSELDKKINELNVPKEQRPRLHYMSMVGDKYKSQGKSKGWDSFTVGEEYNFRRDVTKFEGVSAVVFPFSIPDGSHHRIARHLYKGKKRFSHRTG
ncbi:hypothetical protein LCGC14_0957830 [marine sediment metagenome]|uniref:PRTase-CE domain-containing protein n=1 Tax=marine sediment metagenome TaxID=412755 RepID=A0A0F9NFB1_9ZZZZ